MKAQFSVADIQTVAFKECAYKFSLRCDSSTILLFATLGEGLGCVLIKSTLGFRGSPGGRVARGNGEQWGTKGIVYEQPGTKEDHSCHSWRAPSK
jgi:hypothetical protein